MYRSLTQKSSACVCRRLSSRSVRRSATRASCPAVSRTTCATRPPSGQISRSPNASGALKRILAAPAARCTRRTARRSRATGSPDRRTGRPRWPPSTNSSRVAARPHERPRSRELKRRSRLRICCSRCSSPFSPFALCPASSNKSNALLNHRFVLFANSSVLASSCLVSSTSYLASSTSCLVSGVIYIRKFFSITFSDSEAHRTNQYSTNM